MDEDKNNKPLKEQLDLLTSKVERLEKQIHAVVRSYNDMSEILITHGLAKNEGSRKI